jgi:hypothetical protein
MQLVNKMLLIDNKHIGLGNLLLVIFLIYKQFIHIYYDKIINHSIKQYIQFYSVD